MPVLLVLVVATAAELAVLIAVGRTIGIPATLGLLVLTTLVGIILLRWEGSRTLLAFREAVRTRRPPAGELVDGVLLAAAGILVVLPGFLSDAVGLLLLLPPLRALLRRRMLRTATPGHFGPGHFGPGRVGGGAFRSHQAGAFPPGGARPGSPPGTGQPGPVPAPDARRVSPDEVTEGEVIEGEIVDEPPEHGRKTDPR